MYACSANFLDIPANQTRVLITGAHTQAIESNWGHLKTKILRQMRGTKEHLIPGHLAEYWWKNLHNNTPFWDIITEISRQFPLVQ